MVPTFKKVDYTLQVLKNEIDQGILGLPDIQRPFVWENTKVRDLFDSLYKGFPVGYLLFWSNDHLTNTKQIGTREKQRVPQRLIVDGQQRLTALYAVLTGSQVLDSKWQKRDIQIAFKPESATFDVADAATKKNPEYIPNISIIWDLSTSTRRLSGQFVAKLRETREISTDEEDRIYDNIDRLRDLVNYPFVALEISAEVDEQDVSDIFVRINSKGQRLNEADFILTLMSVFWEEGRRSLEKFSRQAVEDGAKPDSPANDFIEPGPEQMLRVVVAYAFRRARLRYVYLLLRGRDLETGEESAEIRDKQFSRLAKAQTKTLDIQNWKDFLQCLVRAGFRGQHMINSKNGLLYTYAFFLIGREDFKVDQTKLTKLISRWFFMQAITGRYTGSPESQMENDLAKLRPVKTADEFVEVLTALIAEELTDDYWAVKLPGELENSASYSPVLSAYHAAQILQHTNVLFTDIPLQDLMSGKYDASRNSIERHHLFPKAFLGRQGITELIDTNQIANMAYISWNHNMEIEDREPKEYWKDMVKKYVAKDLLAEQMVKNALPEGWQKLKYKDFLPIRRSLMAGLIKQGYKKL